MRRTRIGIILGVCAIAVFAAYGFYTNTRNSSVSIPPLVDKDASPELESQQESSTGSNSPFSIKTDAPSDPGNGNDSVAIDSENVSRGSTAVSTVDADLLEPIDVSSLARQALDDVEFLRLAERFRNDPVLLQQLIDEFRQEIDPTRQASLSRLLGEIGGPEVTLTASELVYSGDPVSRRIGLELLQAVQPGNAEARDIAFTLLATEVEPAVLVDTLTTLARPGTVDDGTRQFLSDQVAFLAGHESEKVRSVSLSILSRWSKDGQYTDVIRGGLTDEAPVVRESAAYALVGHNNVTQNLVDSLMSVATNRQEDERARRGAVLALKGMPISDIELQRVNEAELDMDTIRR